MSIPTTLNGLRGFSVRAKDGPIGKIEDFYFDDRTWKVKYAVVHTNRLQRERDVLIIPQTLEKPGRWAFVLTLTVTKEEVENSPDVDTDMPVSMQHELAIRRHYGMDVTYSWAEGFMGSHNLAMPSLEPVEPLRNKNGEEFDPHLFSIKAISGLPVNSLDGKSGHVKDFVVDEKTWSIGYLVVDIGNIFESKNVLVSSLDSVRINSDLTAIDAGVSKMMIHECPEFDPVEFNPESLHVREEAKY